MFCSTIGPNPRGHDLSGPRGVCAFERRREGRDVSLRFGPFEPVCGLSDPARRQRLPYLLELSSSGRGSYDRSNAGRTHARRRSVGGTSQLNRHRPQEYSLTKVSFLRAPGLAERSTRQAHLDTESATLPADPAPRNGPTNSPWPENHPARTSRHTMLKLPVCSAVAVRTY